MADSAPVMVWVSDPAGNCTYLNRPWYEFSGQPEASALGSGWLEILHPDDRARIRKAFLEAHARQTPFRLEYRLRRADGAWRWALDAAEPRLADDGRFLGYVGSVLDITERKEVEDERERLVATLRDLTGSLEARVAERTAELAAANRELRAEIEQRERIAEELRQAQKMEIIGQLTGGVAHDFNNLLTIILGNLETLRRQLERPAPDPARLQRAADNAVRGAERAAALTQRLLAFSRRQPLEPKALDVNRLVAAMSDLLRRTLGERIAVETVLAGGLWATHADPNQLESAILNLALNGRDAMPEGGRLTIETANAHLDESYAVRQPELAPGQYVVVAVTDSGLGMSREVLGQAFEPFFTTKDAGHGTGLGLSQVYGFVKQSGGHVSIYSEPGLGTTVKIYLPRLHGAERLAEPPAQDAAAAADERSQTVLVVEDDDDVRTHSAEVLNELGYRVLEAQNAASALEILEREPDLALLFTDVGLPGGMNGRQLAEEACRRRPRLRVLFTTGYAKNAIVHDGRLDPGVQLITKPFSFAALAAKVRGLLDGDVGPPCVLVVEDEALVRMVAVDALEALGFRVEAAATATEAINKLRLLNGRIDAAVIDIGLPDRGGDALAAEVRALDARLPIVIASGYRDSDLGQRLAGDPAVGFLGKPYDGEALAAALAMLGIAAPAAD
jgi:PAS domain S-box-containing protein